MKAALNSTKMSNKLFNDVYREKDTEESQVDVETYRKGDVFGSEEGHAVTDLLLPLS